MEVKTINHDLSLSSTALSQFFSSGRNAKNPSLWQTRKSDRSLVSNLKLILFLMSLWTKATQAKEFNFKYNHATRYSWECHKLPRSQMRGDENIFDEYFYATKKELLQGNCGEVSESGILLIDPTLVRSDEVCGYVCSLMRSLQAVPEAIFESCFNETASLLANKYQDDCPELHHDKTREILGIIVLTFIGLILVGLVGSAIVGRYSDRFKYQSISNKKDDANSINLDSSSGPDSGHGAVKKSQSVLTL